MRAPLDWLGRTAALVWKELLLFLRDPVLAILFLWLFTVEITVAGSGVVMQLRRAPVAVLDHDRSEASRDLVARLREPSFVLRGEVPDERAALAALTDGSLMAVLVVPPGFSRDLAAGTPTSVQLLLDGSNAYLAGLASSEVAGNLGRFLEDRAPPLAPSPLRTAPRVEARNRILYNSAERDSWYYATSELISVLSMLAILLPAAFTVRERERGTLEQLRVAPLDLAQILLPKVLTSAILLLVGSAISLHGVLGGVFGLRPAGSQFLFFAAVGLFAFAAAGIGLVLGAVARTLGQVVMMVLLVLMPLVLLSGAWTPPEAMPAVLRHAMAFSPLHYLTEAVYGVLFKGAGPAELWDEFLGLLGLGTALFALGAWRLARSLR